MISRTLMASVAGQGQSVPAGTAAPGTPGGSQGTASAYDDEFSDSATLASKWTLQFGILHLDVNSTLPGQMYLQGAALQAMPATPFTATAKVAYVDWDAGPGIGGVWIVLAAGTPGPYVGFGVDVGNPGTMWLSGSKFDSSGNFTGNVNVHATVSGYGYAVPHLNRMTVHSATNIDDDVSFDGGVTWTNVVTGYDPGFTLNYIGLESGGARSGFDYFRVT